MGLAEIDPRDPQTKPPIVLAITGASGAVFAVRLLEILCKTGNRVHLTISPSGADVLYHETGIEVSLDDFRPKALGPHVGELVTYHHHKDMRAGIASGSYRTRGMIVAPCSMSTLASIAHGVSTNLITRAADVHLKERRKLVLLPRETPLSVIHLENMLAVTRAGAIVMPAAPGWYHKPKRVDELVDFLVARICDQFEIEQSLVDRWGESGGSKDREEP